MKLNLVGALDEDTRGFSFYFSSFPLATFVAIAYMSTLSAFLSVYTDDMKNGYLINIDIRNYQLVIEDLRMYVYKLLNGFKCTYHICIYVYVHNH